MDRRTKRALLDRLRLDAQRIAYHFGLRYRAIEAERAGVKRRYGVCYSDGEIRIRLRHAATGRPLKYSSLVNTLCHELAHLRHFDHGPRFRAFYLELLGWARRQGIYRPHGPRVRGVGGVPGVGAPPAAGGAARAAAARSPQGRRPGTPREGPRQLTLFG